MVEKMKFLSITGPTEDFDRVLDQYLSKYSIHLENTLSELKTVSNLRPFTEANPYKDPLNKVTQLLALMDSESGNDDYSCSDEALSTESVALKNSIETLETQKKELAAKRDTLIQQQETISHFHVLQNHFADILSFDFIHYRAGRVPQQYYANFIDYVDRIDDTLFYQCDATNEYVYGIYFVSSTKKDKADAVFASLHFETIVVRDIIKNALPEDMQDFNALKNAVNLPEPFKNLADSITDLDAQIGDLNTQISAILQEKKPFLIYAKKRLEILSSHFDVRKLAACIREDEKVYFILCGWMPDEQADALMKDAENDSQIAVVFEDKETDELNPAPTRLKNPGIFKPFQMYTKMYGLPAQNEIDPTIFVGITYAFIFGWMFGDVGQGAILAIGGLLLYKFKHMDLAGIIGICGFFSIFFGFMFGSVFGFEDVIDAVWLRPISAMSSMPLVGSLNTVFIYAIAFGMILNLIVMVFHIINGIRAKDVEYAVFNQNGVAGLVFYGALAATIALYMSGRPVPGTIVLVIMFGIPLLLIAMKEPICNALNKKKELVEGGIGMYVVQAFFELFEILLSYFSNTLSFVRVGAFAVSHAAMMEVVMMLAGATNGSPNIAVVVIGNLFVCGLEGLIVGIQVLRLEYYELFSRFYKGTGREFQPYTGKQAEQ